MERQIEWSPDSWEVNVKRPSEGPFVLTTVWDDSTSCWVIRFGVPSSEHERGVTSTSTSIPSSGSWTYSCRASDHSRAL